MTLPTTRRRGGLPLGHWHDIPITAHWTVLLAVALFTDVLATSALPDTYRGASTAAYWITAAVTAAAFFVTLVAHELAHAVAARQYGIGVRRITLWALGGLTELDGDAPRPGAEAAVAGAGPATSLALGGVLAALSVWVGGGLAAAALAWLGAVNLLLAVFNVLPAAPLDGGRLLRAVLWHRLGDRDSATVTAARAGQGLGVFLLVLGLLQVLEGVASGIWMSLVGWFLFGAAQGEMFATRTRRLTGLRARDIMTPARVLASQWWTVAQFLGSLTPDQLAQQVYPVVDWDGRPAGAVTLRDLERVPPRARDETRVREVALHHRPAPLVVDVDAPCESFLLALRLHGGTAVVTQDAHPVGVITEGQLNRKEQAMTHVVDWPIRLSITEDDARTVARAEITTKDNTLSAEGVAVRNPTDSDVPEIGDELAAGRALAELGRLLVSAAAADVAAFGDEPVRLTY